MASVVDTTVKWFTSDTAGVPVLNGIAGSGIAVLDACLVTGYGTLTATSLVVAGGVATATFPSPHAARVLQVVEVAGSSIAALNGEQRVTVKAGNTLSWATAAPDGTASGTITVKVAGAGWEKLYAGTNKAVYRSLSPERHGQVLRVDDASGQAMRVVAYESMSDVDTGVNPFPTAAQISDGGYWWKSNAATAAGVAWEIRCDARFFLWGTSPMTVTHPTAIGAVANLTMAFGDLVPLNPAGNPHMTLLAYSASVSASNANSNQGGLQTVNSSASTVLARSPDGATLSPLVTRRAYVSGTSTLASGNDSNLGASTDAVDGRLYTSRMFVTLSTGAPLADIPGLIYIPQTAYGVAARGDTMDGAGEFEGRVLSAWMSLAGGFSLTTGSNSSSLGLMLVDSTGPWRD